MQEVTKTTYICDFCKKEYDSKDAAWKCEQSHDINERLKLEDVNKQLINCLIEIKNYCSISPSTVFPSDIIDIINKYNINKALEEAEIKR